MIRGSASCPAGSSPKKAHVGTVTSGSPLRVEMRTSQLTAWTTCVELTAIHGSGGSMSPRSLEAMPAKAPVEIGSEGAGISGRRATAAWPERAPLISNPDLVGPSRRGFEPAAGRACSSA